MLGRKAAVVWVAKRPSEREVLNKQDEGLFKKTTLCYVSIRAQKRMGGETPGRLLSDV